MLKVGVDVEIEKEAGAATVNAMTAVELSDPDFPVIVTLDVPAEALDAAVNVKVLDAVVLVGLKDAVTPAGRPAIVKATVPANPFVGAIVMAAAAVALCTTVTAAVEVKLKPGAAGMVRSLINAWPLGDPQPLVKSYPGIAAKPVFPLVMSCIAAA